MTEPNLRAEEAATEFLMSQPEAGPKLLTCPVRGPLTASAVAADGLTITEEARRIELIHLLIDRGYPPSQIAVETVVLKRLGERGRNSVRADVMVFDCDAVSARRMSLQERLEHVLLVAEVKREQKSKASGIENQLEPALRLIPAVSAIGVYWDDVDQLLFVKRVARTKSGTTLTILADTIANLPSYGVAYRAKPIVLGDLRPSRNLMGVLENLANVFRSHKVNDEATRYRETVKLILARYCDERAAKAAPYQLSLQVLPGADPQFMDRVAACYSTAARRYKRAETLFPNGVGAPALSEQAMREAVRLIQAINFSAASSEVMQQVFMSFVPAVFKKSLDQYFTPLTLIDAMIDMVNVGDNDNVADPAMGTADFLSAAMAHRQQLGDDDIVNRIHGADADPMAFDLAVVNMILHRDGQSNFVCEDSIEQYDRWERKIDVALCNPPFGEKSLEKRSGVLEYYDLGHAWSATDGSWAKTDELLPSQQLGILFIEKCYKLLADGGRMAIILPEGYLCTPAYTYVRQWIVEHLRILALVELPRRIFNRSDADLRANILVAQRLPKRELEKVKAADYPIFAELIRRVGFKMGKGYSVVEARDAETGIILRDDDNKPIPDSDFLGLKRRYRSFRDAKRGRQSENWEGGRLSDVLSHRDLDLKPRRLAPRAIVRKRHLAEGEFFYLREVADVVEATIDLQETSNFGRAWRLVEGTSIRAVEGTVVPHLPQRAWRIIDAKQRRVFKLRDNDIVVGLVRPERRNIGLLVDDGDDLVGTPDGVAIVRVRKNTLRVTQEYLFAAMRSEECRVQLWTESGGTSYGKLRNEHIEGLMIAKPSAAERDATHVAVSNWAAATRASTQLWNSIGSVEDRIPIINSPILGLESDEG